MKLRAILLSLLFIVSFSWSSMAQSFNELAMEEEQSTFDVIPYLELKSGDVVADLGAGGGYFSVKMAKAVGDTGTVYAVDIDRSSIEYIKKYAKQQGVNNIKTILAKPDDSLLPKNTLDLIFIRNTYHHLDNRIVYFKKIAQTLKPNGKVAIIDYLPEKTNFAGHSSDIKAMKEEMREAGFKVYKENTNLKRQSFVIFQLR
jgi:ubiquinone/menaquinone biosynthesis C-methylase UbiE